MTNTTPNPTAAAAALCDEVIAMYEGNVGTHGPDCYRWHVGCLALRVRQALAPQENPKCEHGIALSDLCQFADHVANAHERDLEEAASISRSLSPEALEAKRVAYLADQEREKLIAEATERINEWSAENQCPSDIGMIVRLRDALAAQPVLDPDSDERVIAWERVADHPALKPCYAEVRPLLFAVLDRLTNLFELEQAVTELAPAPVAVLDPEKVAALIDREFDDYRPVYSKEGKCINSNAARALCEAAKRGELS